MFKRLKSFRVRRLANYIAKYFRMIGTLHVKRNEGQRRVSYVVFYYVNFLALFSNLLSKIKHIIRVLRRCIAITEESRDKVSLKNNISLLLISFIPCCRPDPINLTTIVEIKILVNCLLCMIFIVILYLRLLYNVHCLFVSFTIVLLLS